MHEFRKSLIGSHLGLLNKYRVNANNKEFEFWQRDSLAILLYTEDVAIQKFDYIHANPLAKHWDLASDPSSYLYSSATYDEQDVGQFGFLKNLMEEF